MIFGVSGSKFQSSGGSEVLLENSILTPNWVDSQYIEKTSIVNGNKTFDTLGDYSDFTVLVHLFKYNSPVTKFQEIYQYNHNDVYFCPHLDGSYIKTSTNATASFTITDMKLGFLDSYNQYDILTIKFKSKTYTDITTNIFRSGSF